MQPSEQKPAMFAYKLKFILFPQLITKLNNYACSLPPLADVNCLLFQSAFSNHVNPWLVKGGLQYSSGDLIWLPLSVHICLSLVLEYWPFWVHVQVMATLHSTICVIFLLCWNIFHHPPHPRAPPTQSLMYAGPILMNFMKNAKNWQNQPLSTCQVSCTKPNR